MNEELIKDEKNVHRTEPEMYKTITILKWINKEWIRTNSRNELRRPPWCWGVAIPSIRQP
jgi:hypothetical protein